MYQRSDNYRGYERSVTAKAVCSGCGGEVFEIGLADDGIIYLVCAKEGCGHIWASTDWDGINREAAALVKRRDEPPDVVPQAG